jgi:pimeloyl-ACP methyl ester carboxylesterase
LPSTTINGFSHFYEDTGAGEPVVLLHGISNSSYYFKRLIPGLAAEFHVIAPHLRGMGFSQRVEEVPPGAWLEDVLALLDQLAIESAHFYGVSLGAAVGMRLALEHPRRVLTLTLDAPFLRLADLPPPTGAKEEGQDPPPWVVAELRAMHGDDWRTVMRNCERYREQPGVREFLSVGEKAKAIAVPTLVIRGDNKDAIHPLPDALAFHQLIPGSRLWVAPDTGCLVTRQAPAEALRVFCDFALDHGEGKTPGGATVNAEHVELLGQVDLFANLRRSALARLAGLVRTVEVHSGDTVFRQGESAEEFYVVARGSFEVLQSVGKEKPSLLRVVEPGQFFGEMALVTRETRSATVRCAADGELLEIDGRHFRALVQRDPTAAMALASTLGRYVHVQDQTQAGPADGAAS